jgi:hypothetical protein
MLIWSGSPAPATGARAASGGYGWALAMLAVIVLTGWL